MLTPAPTPPADVPPIVRRPKIAAWLFARDLSYREGGELFGCSHEQVRKMCLPFGDADRRVPMAPLMERIILASNGELQPGDFYETQALAA